MSGRQGHVQFYLRKRYACTPAANGPCTHTHTHLLFVQVMHMHMQSQAISAAQLQAPHGPQMGRACTHTLTCLRNALKGHFHGPTPHGLQLGRGPQVGDPCSSISQAAP